MTGEHLTGEQVATVERWLAEALPVLRLAHWHVWIAAEPAEDHCHASIEPTDGRYVAMLYLARNWPDRPPEDRRLDLTHELIHLHHRDVGDTVRLALARSGQLSRPAFDLLWEQMRLHLEAMVDALSYVIVRLMPAWPEEDR